MKNHLNETLTGYETEEDLKQIEDSGIEGKTKTSLFAWWLAGFLCLAVIGSVLMLKA